MELAKNMNGKELLVSRNRDTGVSIELDGYKFMFMGDAGL